MTGNEDDAAPTWRKSTVSNPSGNCVELAVLADGGVAVRNSRFPDGPASPTPAPRSRRSSAASSRVSSTTSWGDPDAGRGQPIREARRTTTAVISSQASTAAP